MEHLCTRCARLGLRSRTTGPSAQGANSLRAFSTSSICLDEDDQNPSSSSPPFRGRPLPGSSLRAAINKNATPSTATRTAPSRAGGIPLRRTAGPPSQNVTGAGVGTAARTGAGVGTGARSSIGARTGGRPPAPNRLLQRTGPPRSGPGQLLTRANTPGQSQSQRQQAQTQRSGQRGGIQPPPAPATRTDRRVRRLTEQRATKSAEEDDPSSLSASDLSTRVENYINTIVDPPVNPTTELPHTPGKDLTESELRKDWPNTPLSNAGLMESVQQRIEWLAHRLPHGYQTPNQLAMHYTRGYLTRFESEQEKEEVLSVSRQLAQKWADRDTEKSGGAGEVQPENMEFDDLASREGERNGLAHTWIRGTYPEVQKQKMPFLDQIVRNLNNNGTVTKGKAEQFMQTVQSVIVSRQQGQSAGRTQKGAEK